MEKFSIRFGAMCPPLAEQIGEIPNIEQYQADADAITRLYLRGVIPNSAKENAHKRLFRQIERSLYTLPEKPIRQKAKVEPFFIDI